MNKNEISFLISDAIAFGYDYYTELKGFIKALVILGHEDLAVKIIDLYSTHADEQAVKQFVSENFKEVEN